MSRFPIGRRGRGIPGAPGTPGLPGSPRRPRPNPGPVPPVPPIPPGPEPVPGQTFTLTTGIDSNASTPGVGGLVNAPNPLAPNSTVNGLIAGGIFPTGSDTYTSGDVINGNATSRLNVTVAATTAAGPIVAINNLGNVNFQAFAPQAINAVLYSGVGAVNSTNSTSLLTINNGELASTYGLNNIAAGGSLVVDIRDTDTAGSNDTLKLATTGTVAGTTITNADTGIENVTIATSGTNNFSLNRAANAVDGALVVTGAGTNTINIGNQFATNASFAATGGNNDLVFGGAGSPGFASNITLAGFNSLTVLPSTVSSLLFANGSTVPTVNLLTGAGTSISAGNLLGAQTINLVGSGVANVTDAFGSLQVTNAYSGFADVVAVNVANGGITKTGANGYTLGGVVNLVGAEVINLNIADIASTGVTTLGVGSIASSTLTSLSTTTAGNLVTVGNFVVPGAATLSNLNFSGVAGTATINTNQIALANGGVITGSVAGFAGDFDGLTNGTVTFNGNINVDNASFDGSTAVVNINTFAGNDIIAASIGGGVITPGTGVDTATLAASGVGVDTLAFANGDSGLTAATADTITNFSPTAETDLLKFGLFNGTVTNFGIGADQVGFADALLEANNNVLNGTAIYAYVQDNATATTGYVFVDYNGDGNADLGLTLLNKTVTDLSPANFIA